MDTAVKVWSLQGERQEGRPGGGRAFVLSAPRGLPASGWGVNVAPAPRQVGPPATLTPQPHPAATAARHHVQGGQERRVAGRPCLQDARVPGLHRRAPHLLNAAGAGRARGARKGAAPAGGRTCARSPRHLSLPGRAAAAWANLQALPLPPALHPLLPPTPTTPSHPTPPHPTPPHPTPPLTPHPAPPPPHSCTSTTSIASAGWATCCCRRASTAPSC
jgi:hypothetical protein